MPAPFTTRPELAGTFGMVASTHWLASAAGMSILERGGNAFDAAVAAGFVLQVVEPHLNGPGGEMPAVVYCAREHKVQVVCGQGVAPAAASIEAVRRLGLDMIPGTGLLAPCVPGAFGGWLLLLERFGTKTLREVLEPALGYAEGGWPVVPRIADTIAGIEATFRELWQESVEVWLGHGVPAPGSVFKSTRLASTYARILREAEAAGGDREAQIEAARRAWYEGFVAEAIERFVDGQGFLRAADLAAWRATLEDSVSADYQRYTVHKPGPWSQGPVFLQQLSLLDSAGLRIADVPTAEFVHQVVEAAKLAFADREAWYGDPAFEEIPLQGLLADGYTEQRRRLLGEQASLELRPGSPDGRPPRIPWATAAPVASEAGVGDPTIGTCHVDVADREGNLVSCTPSGGWLQSSPAVPGLGFALGTRAQIFNLDPGHPNALQPGKRPRTTLSPSLAFRDGEPWLAFGTPGADQQDQWSLNLFVMLAASEMNLQQAIDAPMWHTNHFPRSFYPHESAPGSLLVEERIGPGAIAELGRRGHRVEVMGPWTQGRLSAAGRDPRRGLLLAAANPRGMQGYAVGR
ncbi:MAG TPA: gamma-glutamyltransferase family protein [Candidatus Dormibacteraeota bacterium]